MQTSFKIAIFHVSQAYLVYIYYTIYATKLWQQKTLADCCPKTFWQENIHRLAALHTGNQVEVLCY